MNHSVSWFNTEPRRRQRRGRRHRTRSSPRPRAAGILWVNSAGNRGQQHWSGTFTDADADGWHEFAPGDEGNTITLRQVRGRLHPPQVGRVARVGAATTTCTSSASTRTLVDGRGAIVASSRNAQTGSQPPTEQLCFSNPGAKFSYAIEIVRVSGTGSPRLDLFISPGPDFEHQVAEGSVTEPASSPAVLAVGAVCWLGDTFEAYSSRGPTIDGRVEAGPRRARERLLGDLRRLQGLRAAPASPAPRLPRRTWPERPRSSSRLNPSFDAAALRAFLESRALDLGVPGRDELFGIGKLMLGDAPAALPRKAVGRPLRRAEAARQDRSRRRAAAGPGALLARARGRAGQGPDRRPRARVPARRSPRARRSAAPSAAFAASLSPERRTI